VSGHDRSAAREIRRTPLVVDIETKSDDAWLAESEEVWLASLQPPANYKKEEAIAKWIAEKVAERREKAPLSPLEGRIVAIGVGPLWSDEPPDVFAAEDERLVLETLKSYFVGHEWVIWCGWRIRIFDMPFLAARFAVHGIQAPWLPDPRDYRSVIDGADVLTSGHLAEWLQRFGLPPKTGTGAQVADMPIEQITEYCRNDVVVERLLLRRLAPVYPSLARTGITHDDD
jgi:hypothetical protein